MCCKFFIFTTVRTTIGVQVMPSYAIIDKLKIIIEFRENIDT